MWQALTEGYLSYRGRSVDSLAKIGATIEATTSESNRRFQQKSAEVIVVGGNEPKINRTVSQASEGLNVKSLPIQ